MISHMLEWSLSGAMAAWRQRTRGVGEKVLWPQVA